MTTTGTRLDLSFAPATSSTTSAVFAAADADVDKRKLTGVAWPLGVFSEPAADGWRYRFNAPPAHDADQLVDVVNEHWRDEVVGRLDVPFAQDGDSMRAVARIFQTSRGNDLLVEASEGVKTGFSVGVSIFEFTEDTDAGTRDVVGGEYSVDHLGVVRDPAFTQARGLQLAASRRKETGMTETTTPPAAPAAPAAVELPTVEELAGRVADFMREQGNARQHPLARFASREHFLAAFTAADEETRARMAVEFALVDQITTNNPGVIPPGWRTDIKANLDRRRPLIAGTGGPIGLPDAGMDSNWPYFDGDLDTIIARQLTEKTELNSVRIDIKKASEPIKTAGVVSDISYQLLMRSSPSYLAAYQAICEAAWARYTEAQFEAKLLSIATDLGTLPVDFTAAGAVAAFRALLFEGSAAVEDATGAPATVAAVSTNVWLSLGGSPSLPANDSGRADSSGTSSASQLQINIDGLIVTRAPFFPDSKLLMTNGDAARFPETGPMVATEEDVAKLGRNVAVWGMYEDAEVYFPSGVVVFDAT